MLKDIIVASLGCIAMVLHVVQVLGYSSVDDYYSDISSFQYISKIRIPCLFAAAADDPYVR